ncbi:MAG TPA: hypothetical protein DCR93_33275, partial [Cytophagales bacterium]|nr:hypothetical protein [Cytophagales bacterium]
RFQAFVAKQTQPAVFSEAGPWGALSETLRALDHNHPVVATTDTRSVDASAWLFNLAHAGITIQWAKLPWLPSWGMFHQLPGYAFNPTRCWLFEPREVVKPGYPHLHTLTDQPIQAGDPLSVSDKKILLVSDEAQALASLAAKLRNFGNRVVTWTLTDSFSTVEAGVAYTLDVADGLHYQDAEQELFYEDFEPELIVTLSASESGAWAFDSLETNLRTQAHPLVYLAKAFHLPFQDRKVQWMHVSYLDKRGVLGGSFPQVQATMMKALSTEYPRSVFKHLTYVGPEVELPQAVLQLAYGKLPLRYVRCQEEQWSGQALTPLATETGAPEYSEDQLHVVTGGAGGIGFEVSKHLIQQGVRNLIVVGRTFPTSRSVKDQQVLDNLNELRTSAEVLYATADVSKASDTESITALVGGRKVHTLWHIAGLKGSWEPNIRKEMDDFARTLGPKVQGTLLLEAALQPQQTVVFSSLNSVMPQPNSVDYAAANAFLDGWVQESPGNRKAINWPGWSEVGMAKNLQDENGVLRSLTTREGLEALDAACMQDAAQILVADVQVEALQGNPYLLVGSPESAPAATQPSATNPATQLVVPEGMTRVEATIREVWMEVLKAEALGLDEDFFELGGHSLLGSMVVNRVVETFEVDLEFEDIFEYGTVRSLAAYVDSLLGEQASAVPEKQHPVAEAEGDFPLSQQQLGIWSVNAKHGDNDFYSIPYSFYLRDSIDATAMQGALEYMVARHASLRTVFSLTTDGPIQRVQEKAPVDLELVDLTGEADPHAVMQLQIQELYKHPFSIEQGPLCQFKLFQLEAKVWVLSSNFHHIICDAISLSKIFFPELQQAYQALVQGQPVPLAPLAVSYAEYALDQQARFAQGELDEHRTFWQQKLGGRGQLSALP